jgi:8-oxo-dGTP pyrophosphatase MutT (NUDIX family)
MNGRSGDPKMHRNMLLTTVDSFANTWASHEIQSGRNRLRDSEMATKFRSFVTDHPGCFDRRNLPGHITGSALITNRSLSRVLLTHHRKLGIWLQLGGHSDGVPDPSKVAMSEALEESGLSHIEFFPYEGILFGKSLRQEAGIYPPIPFDLDSHVIPKSAKDPEHWHFDVRYLLFADDTIPFQISEESLDLKWFTLSEARIATQEDSMERQFQKLELIRSHLLDADEYGHG